MKRILFILTLLLGIPLAPNICYSYTTLRDGGDGGASGGLNKYVHDVDVGPSIVVGNRVVGQRNGLVWNINAKDEDIRYFARQMKKIYDNYYLFDNHDILRLFSEYAHYLNIKGEQSIDLDTCLSMIHTQDYLLFNRGNLDSDEGRALLSSCGLFDQHILLRSQVL